MSNPIISEALVWVKLIARSPVPVAISKTLLGFFLEIILTTFSRHLISIPNEMTLLRLSYSLEIVSNILAICCFFPSVLCLYGFIFSDIYFQTLLLN